MPAAEPRHGRRGWQPRMWRPAKHRPGLAAVKHAQALAAERSARAEQQGRAFVALARVVAVAGGGGWPESMQRELQACFTIEERLAWSVKWGAYLSGQAQRANRAPIQPARNAQPV